MKPNFYLSVTVFPMKVLLLTQLGAPRSIASLTFHYVHLKSVAAQIYIKYRCFL